MEIVFKPIGIVRTNATEVETKGEGKHIEGELEIYPEFEDALEGIDGYSHLFVLGYFHQLRPDQIGPLKVQPRRLVRRGFKLEELPWLGVFSLDSPTRPNPIGLSLVQVIRREGRRIFVRGLDYLDETPILDIKAYRPDYRVDDYTYPDWYRKLMDEKGHV